MSELLLAINNGPKCPKCGLDTFDDWHLSRGLKPGHGIVAITGSLQCHGCGRFFHIDHYGDGVTHSSMNIRVTNQEARAAAKESERLNKHSRG